MTSSIIHIINMRHLMWNPVCISFYFLKQLTSQPRLCCIHSWCRRFHLCLVHILTYHFLLRTAQQTTLEPPKAEEKRQNEWTNEWMNDRDHTMKKEQQPPWLFQPIIASSETATHIYSSRLKNCNPTKQKLEKATTIFSYPCPSVSVIWSRRRVQSKFNNYGNTQQSKNSNAIEHWLLKLQK